MRPFRPVVIMMLSLLALLMGCSDGTEPEPGSGETPSQGGFRVAMLLPGSIDDQSWNTTGYKGLELVRQRLGATVTYTEKVAPEDMDTQFARYAQQGYDLVIGHGGQFIAAAEKVAPRFPRTNFMVVGTDAGNNANLGTVQFIQQELGFLAGAVAGLKTQTGRVAYLSGMPYTHMNEKGASFMAGARLVNPEVRANSLTLGTWADTDQGIQCAERLIDQGYDVIAVDADSAGLAIHALAEKAGIHTIGWATDQYRLAPRAILTSGIQRAESIILAGAELVRLGRWEGKHYKFGLKDGVQDLAPFRGTLTPGEESEMSRIRNGIIEGRTDPMAASGVQSADPCL